MAEQTTLSNLGEALGSAAMKAQATPAAPAQPKLDAKGRAYATGRRKDAIARVWVKRGAGKITINGKAINVYFARPVLQMLVQQPMVTALRRDQVDVECTVISDEHGMLKVGPKAKPLKIGDQVWLIPGHRDPTVNLHDWYVGVRHGRVEALWPIAARGAST